MKSLLLDTNVLSELARPRPDPQVVEFLMETVGFLSVVTLHELRHGAELVKDTRKRGKLLKWIEGIRTNYAKNILPVTAEIAEAAAQMRAKAQQSGKVLHIEDALIAATALIHSLQLATRNTRDFEITGLQVTDPWQ